MVFDTGNVRLGHYRGAPLRVHWTVFASMIVCSGFALAPLSWLAVLALILVHEAGHAALVRHYGLRIVGVDLHGLGGETHWLGRPTLRERVAIAWGGVLAQLGALATVSALVLALGPPEAPWLAGVVSVYTTANIALIALNLLPLPGLDGEVAWYIIPSYRRWARPRVDARLTHVHTLHVVTREPLNPGRDAQLAALTAIERELASLVEAHNRASAEGRRDGEVDEPTREDEPDDLSGGR